nr:phage tail protein [Luteibacter sp. Sphag1AF]
MYAGTEIPADWAVCDGSAMDRVAYGPLFGVIGTTYGPGDGSSTFNLPDFRGRSPMGDGVG